MVSRGGGREVSRRAFHVDETTLSGGDENVAAAISGAELIADALQWYCSRSQARRRSSASACRRLIDADSCRL